MTSESGFDRGQESSSLATPLLSVMNRFRQFQDGFTSPRPNATPSVTSLTRVESFLDTPAHTSSNEPLPLNSSVAPILSDEHQIVPRLVTPMMLLDALPSHKNLMSSDSNNKPLNRSSKHSMRPGILNLNVIGRFAKLMRHVKQNNSNKQSSLNSCCFSDSLPLKLK